jgi:hypothetical protein
VKNKTKTKITKIIGLSESGNWNGKHDETNKTNKIQKEQNTQHIHYFFFLFDSSLTYNQDCFLMDEKYAKKVFHLVHFVFE